MQRTRPKLQEWRSFWRNEVRNGSAIGSLTITSPRHTGKGRGARRSLAHYAEFSHIDERWGENSPKAGDQRFQSVIPLMLPLATDLSN